MTVDETAEVIMKGVQRLFEQFTYSNGYTSAGNSALAEAALVIHIASAFINRGDIVWPESPFRTASRGRTKRLDLLIQTDPGLLESPIVLTFEGKAISPGFESGKVTEIIADHARICDWRLLGAQGRPLFFAVDPPQSVSGILAVLLTEDRLHDGDVSPDNLSYWWVGLSGVPLGVPPTKSLALGTILKSSAKRDVIRFPTPIGQSKLSVAYAIFECGDVTNTPSELALEEEDTAQHEAAHVVVALKCGFKVEHVALHKTGTLKGGTHCDWKSSRKDFKDDEQLLERAFALAYAGSVIDMKRSGKGIGETLDALPTDREAVEDARKTAIDWMVVPDLVATAKLSERGFLIARTIIEEDEDLIASLTDELLVSKEMDEASLKAWADEYMNH